MSKNDIQQNQIYELNQKRCLTDIQIEIVEQKLSMLMESIDSISNAKKLEDKYQFQIN